MVKVLYTDYESALVYACRKVQGDHCVPGKEEVAAISRNHRLTDAQIIEMAAVASETCFTKEDFTSLPEIGKKNYRCVAHLCN